MAPPSDGDLVIVDPDGDLILKVGNDHTKQNNDGTAGQDNIGQPHSTQKKDSKDKSPKVLLIRVSSKFMTMCSPVFNAMLNGAFREGQLKLSPTEPPNLELPEDDPSAMLGLCQVLHFKEDAQKKLLFKHISKIAVLSNKYDCARAARPWFRHQLYRQLNSSQVLSEPQLTAMLNSSYLLEDEDAFYQFTAFTARFLPPQKPGSRFMSKLAPSLQEILFPALRKLREFHLSEFNRTVQKVIDNLLDEGILPGERIQYTHTAGTRLSAHKHCFGAVSRTGNLISVLREHSLWPDIYQLDPEISIDDAWELLKCVGAQVIGGELDITCGNAACESCTMGFEEHLIESEGESPTITGICLVCLKQGAWSSQGQEAACVHEAGNKEYLFDDMIWRYSK